MALTFGSLLDDVSDDTDGVERLLTSVPDPDDAPDGGNFEADPEPGYEPESAAARASARIREAARPVRVTQALRKDVQAKTALLLTMGAGAWQARDEYCGGALMEAAPAVSKALADIFCDSPDIVRWFSAGTGYMKWLNLAAALQPVASAVWGHHIAHTVEADGGPGAPADWSAYAAG